MKWLKCERFERQHIFYSEDRQYKLVRYGRRGLVVPCCERLGVKHCWAAYIPANARGQFGNHIDRGRPYYRTKREAIKACREHKATL